jgi:hypothetical protein
MDTSMIELDVQPTYLKAVAKGKVIVLRAPHELMASEAEAKRSYGRVWMILTKRQTTGDLVVTVPRAFPVCTPLT